MTEDTTPSTSPSTTAGALLRQYREAQGFKLDVLAQALRVSPTKLQALEDDRLDELPDAMFARALTLTVCRQLKVDAAPVLALLPGQDVSRLAAKMSVAWTFRWTVLLSCRNLALWWWCVCSPPCAGLPS